MEKVIIIGSGVAGWTAAIYAARADMNPLVFAGPQEGGQLTMTTEIENFPGLSDGTTGPQLMMRMKEQAEKFGTKIVQKRVTKFEKKKNLYEIYAGEEKYETPIVIIATGAGARWLGLENEIKFRGRGVSTCATCDGFFYKEKEIFVVGGGDSAMEEANFLTKFAKKVTIIHRRNSFRASEIMQKRVLQNPKIEVMWDSEIVKLNGEPPLKSVVIKNTETGEEKEYSTDGIFVAIGHVPNTDVFKDKVDLDEKGFVKTDKNRRTNLPGVFAAGDVQDSIYKQAITAAGTGCEAALEAEKYFEEIKNDFKF